MLKRLSLSFPPKKEEEEEKYPFPCYGICQVGLNIQYSINC